MKYSEKIIKTWARHAPLNFDGTGFRQCFQKIISHDSE